MGYLCDLDGLIHNRKRRNAVRKEELINGGPQDVLHPRFHAGHIPFVEAGDDPIDAAPLPQGPIDDLRQQVPVMDIRQPAPGQGLIQQWFGEEAGLVDPVQDIHGQTAGGLFHSSTMATGRTQPAEAFLILMGKQQTVKPWGLPMADRLASFSMWQ